jgi:hypothetical protein
MDEYPLDLSLPRKSAEDLLRILERDRVETPCPSLVLAALYLVSVFPELNYPDEVWALAYGHLDGIQITLGDTLDQLRMLRHDVFENPCPSLILAGNFVVIYADTQGLQTPTWVHALANGNLDMWKAVIDVTKDVMAWDDEEAGEV